MKYYKTYIFNEQDLNALASKNVGNILLSKTSKLQNIEWYNKSH